jgi:hypothetical protein
VKELPNAMLCLIHNDVNYTLGWSALLSLFLCPCARVLMASDGLMPRGPHLTLFPHSRRHIGHKAPLVA